MKTIPSSRPKVLWLSHFTPFPPKGGAEQRSYNMLVQLSKGADLSFVGLAHSSRVTAYFSSLEEGLKSIQDDFEKFCTSVELIKHGQFGRKLNRVFTAVKSLIFLQPYDYVYLQSAEFQRRFDEVLSDTVYDVIHVDSIGLWQFISSKKLSAKLILNHHNIESVMLERRAEKAGPALGMFLRWEAKKLNTIEASASRLADLNIVCSALDGERLSELHGVSNIKVVPNGVDLEYFKRAQPYSPSGKHLLFVGGLDWYPNRDAAIFIAKSVWPLVKKAVPGVTCSIVGRGSIESLNELAGRDSAFTVPGFVDDIRTVFEGATVFVCPIRDGGGTKLKVLDAMAMGVPLVAHPVACEGIEVEPGSTVAFAETAEEFCTQIVALLADAEQLKRMSGAEQDFIRNRFSYESIGIELRELYN